MLKAVTILAFVLSPQTVLAAKPRTCLIELGYTLVDRTYALVYPERSSPTLAWRATRDRKVALAAGLEQFKTMPHGYAKFTYALDQLDQLAVKLANMRRTGLKSSAEVAEVIRSRDALDLYAEFIDQALIRSFSGGEGLIEFELIPLSEDDYRYARDVRARANQAVHEALKPAQGRTP